MPILYTRFLSMSAPPPCPRNMPYSLPSKTGATSNTTVRTAPGRRTHVPSRQHALQHALQNAPVSQTPTNASAY